MKSIKITLTAFLLCLTFFVSAQSELLSEIPKTKEEFVESEPKVLATIAWLENTPIDTEKAKRQKQYALLLGWITDSPTVTLEINANVLTFNKKNNELIVFFMAGWIKYSLENEYSKDVLQGNLAGIRCAMKIYEAGGLKKDKNMKRLIKLEKEGKLEAWVKEQLAK